MTPVVAIGREFDFPDISSAAWEHTTDRAALQALRSIPGFDTVIRKVVGTVGERNIKLIFTAQALEVGPRQYSDIHDVLVDVCTTLDWPVPRLYVSQTPLAERGRHRSRSALHRPQQLVGRVDRPRATPVRNRSRSRAHRERARALPDPAVPPPALLRHRSFPASNRRSRRSRWRCSNGTEKRRCRPIVPDCWRPRTWTPSVGSLGVMAGGIRGREGTIDVGALRDQAAAFDDSTGLDTFFKFMATAGRTHPFPVVRVNELDRLRIGAVVTRGR